MQARYLQPRHYRSWALWLSRVHRGESDGPHMCCGAWETVPVSPVLPTLPSVLTHSVL